MSYLTLDPIWNLPLRRRDAMGQRPAHLKPPAYLSRNPPVPQPEERKPEQADPLGIDPTRYGDWELKGIAIDF